MNYEAFVEHVKELMKERLPEGWEKAKIQTRMADKVNQKRIGLEFNRGGNVSPTIYMEEFYAHYEKGMKLEAVIEEIDEILIEINITDKFKVTKDWLEKQTDRIVFQLINTESNQALLSKRPHRFFEDLSIVYLWFISCDENGLLTIPVENSTAALFDYSEEQLFQLAYENTKRLLPPVAKPMRQVIDEIVQGINMEIENEEALEKGTGLYVFSNEVKTFGAAAMLYPEVFEQIAELQGDDLYILPSSRHEVITLPKRDMELHDVIEMVEMTNETHTSVEDALSHQVYQYDRGTREITQATHVPHRPFGEEQQEPNKEEVKERNTSR